MGDQVRFLQTTSSKLNELSLQNGRLIVLTDKPGIHYDVDGQRFSVSSDIDSELNDTSENPVQNKVVNQAFSELEQHIEKNFVKQDEPIFTGDVTVDGNLWAKGNIKIGGTDKDAIGVATQEQVEDLFKRLNSNTVLRFYCVEDVTIVLNGVSTTYPANSNVEIKFIDTDVFEIIPTSDNSILSLNSFPGALGTYYPWLEGVKQFSNILFDMNAEDMYSKWSQGNQGDYQVQFAQYANCIFWSDNPYISDVSRRTNYTLYYTSELPLCYSSIPDNTFKAFYLAFNVNSDPNWGNKVYRDSFAKATWATQVFSYYGARTIGIFGHDDPDFNIVLPKDCRGLMFDAAGIENAGTFDAINTTNFGAKSGSWREAFGRCFSLRNLYIKNLKVNLNISWSPISYQSISYIISAAANTNAITISVSPHTYNLLSPSDFELAASKNITIALLTTNYVEDRRLSAIANKADEIHTHTSIIEQNKGLEQKFWRGTQAEYEEISVKDDNAIYIIIDEDNSDDSGSSTVILGDMSSNTYDPQGKAEDIFAYVDQSIENAIEKAIGGSY